MVRPRVAGLLLALGLATLVTSPASGSAGDRAAPEAVVVGQNFEAPGTCPASTTALQASSGDGTDYTVRSAGVLTSFSTIMSGGFRGLVLRPAAPGHYSVVGSSPLKLGTSLSVPTTVPVRIQVSPGDVLGIDLPAVSNGCAVHTGNPADVVYAGTLDTPTDFATIDPPDTQQRINIAAVLEPDVDGDGFGDVSQDGCPALAALQSPCPTPDTKVKHRPAAVVHHRLVRFKIHSTVPGSTFECRVDSRKFKACKPSFKKVFSPGEHRVSVRSVSPLGFTDPTPVKLRFRVETAY